LRSHFCNARRKFISRYLTAQCSNRPVARLIRQLFDPLSALFIL
jgi:hypothetical protein